MRRQMELGILAGPAERVDQGGPDVARHREAQLLDPRLGRLGPQVLLVGRPLGHVLLPTGAEDGVEVLALDRDAGLLEDAGPGAQPFAREVAALLEDERVPVIEGDSVDNHADESRTCRVDSRPPSTREQHTRTPSLASGWEPGGLSLVLLPPATRSPDGR